MADETTPTGTGTTSDGGAGAEGVTATGRPRRSRRATSAVTSPTAAPAAADPSAAAAATVPDAPAGPAPEPASGAAPADAAGPAPRRSRSRRATAPSAAPGDAPRADETPTAGAEGPASAGSAPTDAVTDDAPAPARAPRRRRATSRSAADEPAAPADDATAGSADQPPALPTTEPADGSAEPTPQGDVTDAGAVDGGEDGTATAPRRRRAPRSRSTKAVDAAAEQAPSVDAADVPEVAPADEPRPARARGRRGGRTTASEAAAQTADAPVAGTTAGGDAPVAPAEEASTAAPVLDVLAELGPPRPVTTTGGSAPRLAATALLFQAPDPSGRSRRRRAQAPAGPPVPPDAAAADEADETTPDDLTVADQTAEVLLDPRDDAAEEADAVEEADASEQDEDDAQSEAGRRRRRRRGGRGRRSRSGGADDSEDGGDEEPGDETAPAEDAEAEADDDRPDEGEDDAVGSSRRRRRRRRSGRGGDVEPEPEPRRTRSRAASDEVTALKGSTRLEAKRQRRREGRDAGRRRTVVTEAEFLARRESVDRTMVVRESAGRVQIAVLEDGVLVEHFVSRTGSGTSSSTMVGNVYLGRVQNVLPSMEAAFVDLGKGRNAVLYAGEVNWDAAGLEGQPRRIEQALRSGDSVLVQVTKDPIGHKGARLTSQITLAGRYLVYVPGGGMTGISRKLPDTERARLKKLLKEIVPDDAGVIVRTAAEGASDEELRRDVQRLQEQWAAIEKKSRTASAPALLQGEPDMAIRVVRDIFNDDFRSLVAQGDAVHRMIDDYVTSMAPDLADRVTKYTGTGDVFADHRVDEQLAKGMDRKVWLPSGGSLVIDRTEAMTVIDVNTGKFTGAGGTLEETVTRNNLEAAEEIVRQLRLRDIGGIIVIDFIDMVLESNRDLVLRRLVECLGRDRTKHQVAEVTSLGLVQMTRKRVGQGLVEAFSETCEHCNGRGFIVHAQPVDKPSGSAEAPPVGDQPTGEPKRSRRKKGAATAPVTTPVAVPVLPEAREAVKATLATIAAAAAHAHEHDHEHAADDAVEAATHDAGLPADATSTAPGVPGLDALARALDERAVPADVTGAAEDATGAAEDATGAPDADGADGADGSGGMRYDAAAELRDAVGSVAAVEAPAPGGPRDDEAGTADRERAASDPDAAI